MRFTSRSSAAVATIALIAASACARDRGGTGSEARSSPGPAPAGEVSASAAAAPAAETAAAQAPAGAPALPLESGRAPFLSTLQGGGHQHGDAGPHAGAIALVWDAPSEWIAETPRNPMRRAQYRLPGAEGADEGECAVFYFGPGQGGDAQGNVARWVSMFTTPDGAPVKSQVREQKVGGRDVTRIEATGTYHPIASTFGGEPPPPQPGWTLLGAVVPGPDANWFFRCTGPEQTIAAQRAAFDACIASVREAAE